MNEDRAKRKLTAIFSADVVGYSRLMEADEAWTIQNLEENKGLISKLIEEYQGRVIDSPGDNLLAEFNSVINAVECAVKIQHDLKKKNDNLIESRRMHFRIGINLGDVVEEDGRIYGNGVNIAARLEGLTDPGGICISRRTYDHVKTRLDLGYEYIGEHNVKNISEPVRVYRVLMSSDDAGKVIGEKKAYRTVSRRLAMTAIVALIIIAAGSLIWNIYSHQSGKTEQASEQEQAPAVVNVDETKKTIAVLPFENLSSDPEQEYFVDGLSEELLNCLSKISGLRVTSRTSSFFFKGTKKKLQDIAKDLGVEHILEGSVRKAGDELRITAQLIRAKDDVHLWSETYDRKLEDIFIIQEEVATSVANELKVKLGLGETLKQLGGTDNVEAYELYLAAKGQLYNPGESWLHAYESIKAATELDPDFALAWALKGFFQANLFMMPDTGTDYKAEMQGAFDAVFKAIELEPNLPEAYVVLGNINMTNGNWIEAESAFQKAIDRKTEHLWGLELTFCGFYNSVGYLNRAKIIFEEILHDDPLSMPARSSYISNLVSLGDLEGAKEAYRRGKELIGNQWETDWGWGDSTSIRFMNGDEVTRDEIVYPDQVADAVKDLLGSPEKALSALRRLYTENQYSPLIRKGKSPSAIIEWAAYFGDFDFALDVLEKNQTYVGCSWLPIMKEVRQLPRFKEFVREISLVDYWNKFGWPDLCHPTDDGDFVCD